MPGVLVVDDEPDMRVLVEAMIDAANEGLHVVGHAASGTEAIEVWRETDPDVILLDHRMPGMTGLETAEAILSEQPDQSIVLFSAYLDDAVIRQASALGIRACLPKHDVSTVPDAMRRFGAA